MDIKEAIENKNKATTALFEWIKKNAPKAELLSPRIWAENDPKEIADQLVQFENEFDAKMKAILQTSSRVKSKNGKEMLWNAIAASWNVMCIKSMEAK